MIVSENSLTYKAVVVVANSFGVANTLFLQHTLEEKATFFIVSERPVDSSISASKSVGFYKKIFSPDADSRKYAGSLLPIVGY